MNKQRQILLTIDKRLFQVEELRKHFRGQVKPFRNIPVVKISCLSSDLSMLRTQKGVLYAFDPLSPEASVTEPSDSDPPFDQFYVNILEYLDQWIDEESQHNIQVANLSQAPPKPYSYIELEPMNVATKEASKKDISIVVAVGNKGFETEENMLNPWAVADWVIGVGAAEEGGKKIWENSSGGIKGSSIYRPWIVAPGVKISVPSLDETMDKFHGTGVLAALYGQTIKDGFKKFQNDSGTGYAAPHVSRIVMYIRQIMNNLGDMLYCWPIFFNWKVIPNIVILLINLSSYHYTLSYAVSSLQPYEKTFNFLRDRIHSELLQKYGAINASNFTAYFSSLSIGEFISFFIEQQVPAEQLKEFSAFEPIFNEDHLSYLIWNADINRYISHDSFTYITEMMYQVFTLSEILPNFTNYDHIPPLLILNNVVSRMVLNENAGIPYDKSVYAMKRILANMAQKIPGCQEHRQGHGYVDDEIFKKYFCSIDGAKLRHFLEEISHLKNLVS